MRWALGIFIGLLLALPASAGAADSVVLFGSTPGLYPATLYDSANSKIVARPQYPGTDSVEVAVTDASGNAQNAIDIGPGQNKKLTPGVYDNATGYGSERPSLSIDSAGCSLVMSRFEVKDIARGADNSIQRLWVIFEEHCSSDQSATYGEIRIGEPATVAVPSIARWPEGDLGRPYQANPVYMVAPAGGLHPGAASVTGTNGSDFSITADGCNGQSVAAGASCPVTVLFKPAVPGTRTATLHVPGAGDATLQGWVHGGTTKLVTQSDAGDPIGDGASTNSDNSTSNISIGANPGHMTFGVDYPQGWEGNFAAPPGGQLVAGHYAPVGRDRYSGSNAGMDIEHSSYECDSLTGDFTVTDATYDSYGALRTFGVNFTQHCEGAAPALHGTFDWRVGDTAAPAPWMAQPAAGGTNPAPTAPAPPTSTPSPAPSDPCAAPAFKGDRVRTGTKRSNRIRGSRKPEVIRAGAGNDVVRAGGGSDCVDGGSGRDRIDGGAGDDVLVGGSGRDVIVCGAGRDMAIVGPGDRTRGCEVKVRVRR